MVGVFYICLEKIVVRVCVLGDWWVIRSWILKFVELFLILFMIFWWVGSFYFDNLSSEDYVWMFKIFFILIYVSMVFFYKLYVFFILFRRNVIIFLKFK